MGVGFVVFALMLSMKRESLASRSMEAKVSSMAVFEVKTPLPLICFIRYDKYILESDLMEFCDLAISLSIEYVPVADNVYCFLASWSIKISLAPLPRLTIVYFFSF